MNSVERVKSICKNRKIPISKLEKDLGFSNGYIGQLRKGVFPDDRLGKIADYLGVTVDYLMNGEKPSNKAKDERDIKQALEDFKNRRFPWLRISYRTASGTPIALTYRKRELTSELLNI